MSDDQGTLGAGLASTEALGQAGAGAPSDAEHPAVPAPTAPDHLICPGCQHSVPTGDFQSGSIRCNHCGNTFRLERMQHGLAIDEIRLIGRFQLLDRVGQGSFGTVWRARDTQLDRVVALKIPHEHALAAGLDADRLAREARIAAQLRHPGIVRLYEILTLENIPVLVCDFIEGIPLKEWLEKRRLTFRESALLVAQIAEALDHAHEHGLVHRDVKPANIMIEKVRAAADRAGVSGGEPAGGRLGQPIVVDFGLAVRPEADTVMTVEGQIVGTPAYMSPEQAAGRVHDVDRRSDVYSLGVVLYQLLCGELPFRGSKVMLIHQVLHEDPRPPRRVNDRVPRDLETICLKALAKSPSRRYGTAGELAADLHRFLRGEPCRARPVGRVERGWLWAMRNKALAGAIGLAAVLLSATVVVSLFAAVREKRHAEQLRGALREANHRLAENYLDRGLTLCERGDVAHGLLLLTRGLTAVPDDAGDLGRVLRANLAGWQAQLDSLVAQRRHGAWVTAVAFSPDGKLAATGGRDHMVRLWEGAQAEPLGSPIDCTDEVRSLAFSPDGTTLAIVGRNDKVRFWDIRRAQFSPTVVAHGPRVFAIAYSRSGKVLATGGGDRQVRFWDPDDGRPLPLVLPHAAPVSMVAFAPDDQTILTATEDGEIRLWDTKSGAPRRRSSDHARKSLLTGALGPDGRWLATTGKDWSVRIWDAASLELVHELPHPGLVRAIAFGAGGQTLVTASTDKVARLWDVRSGEGLGPAAYHQQGVEAVAFSPDGSRIVTGSDDGVCQFRRSRMADPRCLELAHRTGVGIVGFSPDGRVAVTGTKPYDFSGGEVQLWDIPTGRRLGHVTHSNMVTAAIFSADGRVLATASADGTARLMDVATGQALCPPLRHEQWVHAIALNPQATRLLTACEDCAARLWDVPTGRYLDRSFAHEQPVVAVAFSPDGSLALTGSADGTARLWDVASGRQRHVFRHREFVRGVAFSPDGKTVLTASLDHTARLWQVESGQPIGKPLVHQDEVLCATFGPDGETVLTGSKDNMAQLWQVATTDPLGSPLAHQGPVLAVAYSPDRATVATASSDATARCWDIATSQPLGPALRHRGVVTGLAFGPNGRLLITGSQDRTARIWQAPRTFDASPARAAVWIQTLCGMKLAGNEALALLTPEEWQNCCQQLRELGGPPIAESR